MKYYKYIRIILIALPILFLFYLFNKQFPLNGKLEIVRDFKKPNAFIGDLTPVGRLSENSKDGVQIVKIDPVYFDLELPADYETAAIELTYQSKNQPVIEIGGLISKDIWNFKTEPIQNSIIDELGRKWNVIKNQKTIFLQKEKKFNSIQNFLNNLPPLDEIAVFNYNLAYNYVYPNYAAGEEYLEIENGLRGKHNFYTYLGKGEDLNFTFWLKDLNEHRGGDDGRIEVYRGSVLIKQYDIKDDGIVDTSKKAIDLGEFNISLNGLKQGVYRINLFFTDDILIQKIKTKQKLIAFINKINLYNFNIPENVNLFSDSSLIKTAANYIAGLQTIKINERNLNVKDLNIEYYTENKNGLVGIEIPKGNILIQSDGLFSFSKDQFFDPRIKILNSKEKLNGVKYIIADYEPPVFKNDWSVGKAVLKLPILYKKNNMVKIIISAPNLDKNGGEIKINKIRVILKGSPFLTRVGNRVKYLLKH